MSVLAQVLCLGVVLTRMLVHPPRSSPVLLTRGVQLGLIAFLLGTVPGAAMIIANAHTIGAPDGGPGMPVVQWSTIAGDLRIAHFLGLHGKQIFPLMGFALARWDGFTDSRAKRALAISFVVYAGAMAATMIQAMLGLPLFQG